MVVLPVDRLVLHVAERVVHPTHVPLQAEAQPAEIGRLGNAIPGGRFLGDRQHAGMLPMSGLIEPLEEVDRFEILAATEAIGHPLPFLATVIEIEHGGHGIDPQPVDMVLVEPEQGVGNQEIANLVAAVVED